MIGWLATTWRRLRFLFDRDRRARELGEEVAFHLERQAEDLRAAGISAPAADRLARRRFGNRSGVEQDAREVWAIRWLDATVRDVRLALRGLRRAPGFSLAALATLALGIGGTTAIYSLVHAALFEPLPYPEADRLVNLHLTARADGQDVAMAWSYPKFAMARERASFTDGVAGFNTASVTLRGEGPPERVVIEEVSADYFPLLGARAAIGRLFGRAEDSVPDANPVVVLSHPLWVRRFGADSTIVGKTVSLAGHPYTAIGVMAPRFRSLSGAVDLWAPLAMVPTLEYREILSEAGNHWLGVVARLRPGVTPSQAASAMAGIGSDVDARYRMPNQSEHWSATAAPLSALRVDPVTGKASLVLLAAVGLVLLIATANVAGLLLVRATGRARELAVRAAVGAGRGALTRQLLVESLVLSLLGGSAGIWAAHAGVTALVALGPRTGSGPAGLAYLLDPADVRITGPVLIVGLALTVLTGLLIGLIPARRGARMAVVSDLKGDTLGGSRSGFQQLLIGAEAALALVLLVGAGLMIRSFAGLAAVDVGFVADRVLSFRVAPADQDLAARDGVGFRSRAVAALEAIPGVTAVGVGACAPLTDRCSTSVVAPKGGVTVSPDIGIHLTDAGYFRALRIPLVEGRLFGPGDGPGAPRVVLVNRAAAAALWPGQSPIGKQLAIASAYFFGGDSTATVVGVVGDVRYQGVERPAGLDAYLPASQRFSGRGMFFVATEVDPLTLVPAVREAIRSADPGLPVYAVQTVDRIAAAATSRTRFLTVLLGVFSAVALGLAAVGVYGVVAFALRSRAREISIRLAIGAAPRAVVGLLVRQAAGPVAVGIGIGAIGSLVLVRLAGTLLFGVEPNDPLTLTLAAFVLAATGLTACWIPARRAARMDPAAALKADG